MRVFFHPSYIHPVPEGHKFPMEKYDLIPRQLVYEGVIDSSQLFEPDLIALSYVLLAHDEVYVNQLLEGTLTPREQRVTGFVHNPALVERELHIMEGTRLAAQYAFEHTSIGFNIAGGTHHAYANRGEGFCLLNDQAIAAHWLLDHTHIKRILIIDLDVHQGNGTAAIFQDNSYVFTFSMHGKNNYPLHKEQSDLDVALLDGCTDAVYLFELQRALNQIISQFQPEFIFYQCGVDILYSDSLGKLAISIEGSKERDRLVFEFASQLGVPVVCSMGGGYSKDIRIIVDAHVNTFRVASRYWL